MRYLVTVGVPDSDIPYVPKSVERMAACLKVLGYQQVLPALTSLTRKRDLKTILGNWATGHITPDDLVILYFAGHGASTGRHYLGLPDTDWNYPARTALATDDLLRVLAETPLRNLLMILDTCYAGQAGLDAQRIADSLQGAKVERGFWLITASFPRQEAGDSAFATAFDQLIRNHLGAAIPRFEIPSLVEDLRPRLPSFQRAAWTLIGLAAGRAPDFLPNPNFYSQALAAHPIEEREFYRVDLQQHWKPRAMSSEAIFHAGNWYFTGRTEALRRITDWFGQPDSGGRARIVTGNPGAGKSAVLGYLVTVTDRDELQQPALQAFLASMPEGTRPPAGSVSFAFHLKGRTLAEAQAAMAAEFETTPDEVLGALATRREKTVLIFDALDEAAEPAAVGELLLRPLTGYSHIWLLVGTRRPEMQSLGPQTETIDLDAPEYRDDADVAAYVRRLLLAEGETRRTPYRDSPTAAEKAAAAVSREAAGNFLVARILARSLIERNTVLDPAREPIPKDARQAFGEYLKALGKHSGLGERRLRTLLLPLAYSEGQGLPREVWARVAGASVDEALELAAAFVAEYAEDGRTVYRLYHEALAESLRDARLETGRHRDIARALMDAVPDKNWLRADWYTRKYLASHAARGEPSLLEELVLDTRFLLAADVPRLLEVSATVRAPEAVRRMNWFGLASDRLSGCDEGERVSYLELVAVQNGAPDLAEAAAAAGAASGIHRRWQTRWARWAPVTPHRVLRGHEGSVNSVAIRAGVVVSGGEDGTVRLWSLTTGQPIGQPLRGHEGPVNAVAAGDRVAVSGSADGTVRFWDAETGQPIGRPVRGHDGPVYAVAVDGGAAISGGFDGAIRQWDLTTGRPVGESLRGHNGPVNAVAAAGGIAVSGSADGTLQRWDLTSRRPIGQPLSGHENSVTAVALGPGVVVSGGWDGTVRRWDLETGRSIGEPLRGHERRVKALVVGNGVIVSGGLDHTVRLWDLQTGEPIGQPILGHERSLTSVALHDGVVASAGEDETVRLWDLKMGQPIGQSRRCHERYVIAVAVSGSFVVSGGDDNEVRLWDLETGAPIGQPIRGHERPLTAVAISEGVIISGGEDKAVRLWDVKTGLAIGQPLYGHGGSVTALAVRDGVVVSGGDDCTVRLWDLKTGSSLGPPLRGHESDVAAVALQDGIVVSGGFDGTVRRWDQKTGHPIGEPLRGGERYVTAVAVRDGVVVSGGDAKALRVWDAKTGRPLGNPLLGHLRSLSAVAVRDGVAASGAEDETVRIWDLRAGRLTMMIRTGSPVEGLAWTPCGICIACQGGLVSIDLLL